MCVCVSVMKTSSEKHLKKTKKKSKVKDVKLGENSFFLFCPDPGDLFPSS